MKMVLYIAILAGLAGASYWLLSHDAEQERKELAMQYQRMQEANEKRQEQTRQEERKEAESKDQAVKMLNAYLNRETQRLNKIVEECKIHMEQIELDQKDLSEAIAEIEKENERRAENSRKRGIKRFDKAERVSLILKNPIMNAMAEKYTGENLNATYAKYKSEMSTELKRYQESEARLRKNRENYYKTVAGLNEEVERRNANARRRNDSAAHETELQLKMLQKRRKPLADKRDMLIKQLAQMKNPHHEKQLEALNKQIEPLDEQIASVQALLTTVRAQTAHMEATEAETDVRKKYNAAQDARTEADNDVHKDSAHEVAVYQTAARYENATLDRIRDSMKTIYMLQSSKTADARKKLDYISRSAANIDFLKSDEIEKIRVKVVEELSKGLTADSDGSK